MSITVDALTQLIEQTKSSAHSSISSTPPAHVVQKLELLLVQLDSLTLQLQSLNAVEEEEKQRGVMKFKLNIKL